MARTTINIENSILLEVKNLQNQVQRSEEKYKDLVESIDAGIFSLNEKGRPTKMRFFVLSFRYSSKSRAGPEAKI